MQIVDINGTQLVEMEITCQVPQGSILGPLSFTIYVNDMKGALDSELLLYADDSTLLVSGKNPLDQAGQTCGPRAGSGPSDDFIWPSMKKFMVKNNC